VHAQVLGGRGKDACLQVASQPINEDITLVYKNHRCAKPKGARCLFLEFQSGLVSLEPRAEENTAKKDLDTGSERPQIVKVEEKHKHIPGRGWISNLALGLTDGVVTNVAFLAGFAGAIQSLEFIRLAGVASMLAGAVSMFFGGLSSARADEDLFQADSRRELSEIESEPEEERQELKNFYLGKGLTQEESDVVVARITRDKKKWLEDLLMHELHLHREELENPLKVAGVLGLAFLVGAFVPLGGYLFAMQKSLAIELSITFSLIFLFMLGGWKGKLAGRKFFTAGLEMFLIGAGASALLFLIGSLLVFA
jgi:vacuolar iron transporter family protein